MTLKRCASVVAAALCGLAFAVPATAATSSVRTEHVEVRLVSETTTAAPGGTLYVALRQKIIPGWHTYWRNPGDSGQATSLAWTLPPGWKAGDIVWPTPERVSTGPLTNYVYSDVVLLPVPVTVPADAKVGSHATLTAAVDWLVCKDVCVPESATLALDVPVAAGSPVTEPGFGAAVAATLAASPKPAGLDATFQARGAQVALAIAGPAIRGADVAHAWFYPFDGAVIDHAKPQLVSEGPEGLTLTLPSGYAFQHGPVPTTLAGVLSLSRDHAYEVTARPGGAIAGAAGRAPPVASTPQGPTPEGGGATHDAAAPAGLGALLGALGTAFVGGLILNLMPCVFPVLSIKAAALARHVEAPERARAEGLGYLAGVVATFVGLAALLIAVRAAGQEVGWGFQLQSPVVVGALTVLMLLVALNLSGVFEIGTSVQGAGEGLAGRGGWIGAFFTGALAVVVAAPCTAPFMAGAIGWALTQPAVAALSIFLALGLGLGAPLTLIAFVPALFRRMPRPGAWMEGLRHLLAFPMYATAGWLAWVFALQVGVVALPFLFAASLTAAFAAWLWGVAQRRAAETGSAGAGAATRIGAAVAIVVCAPLLYLGARETAPAANAAQPSAAQPGGGLQAQPWSPARVAELTGQGKPVLVDFTAAWCVTCQVNERTALAGRAVAEAFARTGGVYLKADWTRRDATIARALAEHGRSGVPLYLVYAPGVAEPKVLPQLLTEGAVVAAIEAAAKRA